nr:hypothetical protein [Campylobacter sp.]
DLAINKKQFMDSFMKQAPEEGFVFDDIIKTLEQIN